MAGLAGLFSLVLGIVGSLVIVRAICTQMWFLSYHLLTWPLLTAIPVLLLLGIAVPLVVYRATDQESE